MQDINLSRNFWLSELVRSETASRLGIDNTPPKDVIVKLKDVAENILQPCRDFYGRPFRPSSGFRCLKLNRALGSKDTSQHVLGEAVDFEIPGVSNYDLACYIRDNLEFDKLILEFYEPGVPNSGWVHCSYRRGRNRKEVYTTSNGREYLPGLIR